MQVFDGSLLQFLLANKLTELVFQGEFGLEKENLRVDEEARLALTPHPDELGHKLKNPYITTDFSESQVEMITPVCSSIEEAYDFLNNLDGIIALALKGEYLWPQSNPPVLPKEEEIPVADFGPEGSEQTAYRKNLAVKYGKKKQLFSGIHYNFSFSEQLLRKLQQKFAPEEPFLEFKNRIYLRVAKNYLQYRWLLIYLTGASPVVHRTFSSDLTGLCRRADSESCYCPRLSSVRNSKYGYKNTEDYLVSYDSIESYIADIQALIDAEKIQDAREFYCPVRLKTGRKAGTLNHLKDEGVRYVELRIFDLNPFAKCGITLDDLYLIHLFIVYSLLKPDFDFTGKRQKIANLNHNLASVAGMHERALIFTVDGRLTSFRRKALSVLDELGELVARLGYKKEYLTGIVAAARDKITNPENTYAAKVVKAVKESGYVGFHMQKAREYLALSRAAEAKLLGYEDLELSTQILIKSAIKRGIYFTVLDRKDNFLRLSDGKKTEYVKQATKTSLDTYSTVLVMENKVVTKEILKEHGFRVPRGEVYYSAEDAIKAYDRYRGGGIVVKPKSTNYGLGITIFKTGFSAGEYGQAVEFAFRYDDTVLVEEFVSGKEYRFLVLGGEVAAVIHRVPANVTGDGKKTIRELVAEKNADPRRGRGHKTPLEKISLGETEKNFLAAQRKSFSYIPAPGETVFLRENSNISTGGDSIDYTDLVHESYKEYVKRAVRSIGAVITGVDAIIDDVTKPHSNNCTIIELNFNPAIHMHCFPYKGKNRRIGDKILDLLFGPR